VPVINARLTAVTAYPWSRSPAAAAPRGGSRFVAVPEELAHLAERQWGVLTRAQLHAGGFHKDHIRSAMSARRWQPVGRQVVVLHNAPFTQLQREWVAVLLAGKPAALARLSAATAAGLTGFADEQVHVVVARDSNTGWPEWVKVHNSRRFSVGDIATADAALPVDHDPPRAGLGRRLPAKNPAVP
jgi:hypothetical protein